jgi:hypothetical protein
VAPFDYGFGSGNPSVRSTSCQRQGTFLLQLRIV